MNEVRQRAVFLDRDGVINQEHGYVHTAEDFHFFDGVFAACRLMREAGYRLIIITNQAGIARGYYTEDDFLELTRWMLDAFRRQGIDITGVFYCPHHPAQGRPEYRRECDCRKPAPGMIVRAAREYGLDLWRSVLVGDKLTDIEAGRSAGVGFCALVLSGHPVDEADYVKADRVFPDLSAFAEAVAVNTMAPGCGGKPRPARIVLC